jgi:hypothetical protein
MFKTLSTWKPWSISPVDRIIQHAQELQAGEICLKAADGKIPYGVNAWVRARWGGATQYDLADQVREAGLSLSIWVVPYFWDWAAEADAIVQAIQRYSPRAVFLDIERFKRSGFFRGSNVDERGFLRHVSPFLRRLGRLPVPVYFQCPRRLDLHPEVHPALVLGTKSRGSYQIDAPAAQMYPVGATTVEAFLADMRSSLQSQHALLEKVERATLPHYPTLPTFQHAGWSPPSGALLAALELLKESLGERLLGVNFWALDGLVKLPQLYAEVQQIPGEPK